MRALATSTKVSKTKVSTSAPAVARKKHGGQIVAFDKTAGSAVASSKGAAAAIHAVQKGLPFREAEKLQRSLGVSLDELGAILKIARATLHRRKADGRLDPQESDRVMRFVRLFDRASVVLESADNARAWFFAPQRGLGGEKPVDFAQTELGAREVEDLLERIDHTVYS
jgi:putative toxin-antitoxin system antitoxin component (TIGR02293 family)